jgi:hypothetical protein
MTLDDKISPAVFGDTDSDMEEDDNRAAGPDPNNPPSFDGTFRDRETDSPERDIQRDGPAFKADALKEESLPSHEDIFNDMKELLDYYSDTEELSPPDPYFVSSERVSPGAPDRSQDTNLDSRLDPDFDPNYGPDPSSGLRPRRPKAPTEPEPEPKPKRTGEDSYFPPPGPERSSGERAPMGPPAGRRGTQGTIGAGVLPDKREGPSEILLTDRVKRDNGKAENSFGRVFGGERDDSREEESLIPRASSPPPGRGGGYGRERGPGVRSPKGGSPREDPKVFPEESEDGYEGGPFFRGYGERDPMPEPEPKKDSLPKSGAEFSLEMLDEIIKSPAAEEPGDTLRVPKFLSAFKAKRVSDMSPEEFFLLVEKAVERGVRKALSKK